MSTRISRACCSVIALFVTTIGFCADRAVAQPWVYATGSVRLLGLGQTGSVIDDPWSGTLNPGALAPGMRNQQLFVAYNDNELSFDRVHHNSFVAMAFPPLALGNGRFAPSIGVAYAVRSQVAGVKNVPLSDGTTADYVDKMRYPTVGVVVDAVVQFGAGVTWINAYNSVSMRSSDAHDVGIFARVPILDLLTLRTRTNEPVRIGEFTPEFSVSGGYTWSSRGDVDDLPDYNRFGLGAEAVLRRQNLKAFQIMFARDKLYWTGIRHSNARWGLEFSVGDALAYRLGNIGDDDYSTYGVSIHSRGLTAWLYHFSSSDVDGSWPWYVGVVDVYYDYAHEDFLGNGSSFSEFGFRFDARPLFEL